MVRGTGVCERRAAAGFWGNTGDRWWGGTDGQEDMGSAGGEGRQNEDGIS